MSFGTFDSGLTGGVSTYCGERSWEDFREKGDAMKKYFLWVIPAVVVLLIASFGPVSALDEILTDEEQLGKSIFFDNNLSINLNQSCASCHGPEVGWTGPDESINAAGAVYEGSIPGRIGNRKPPSVAYATQSPIFHMDKKGTFIGGNFWDGRATGERLGNPAADQAQGPFLNPLEQGLPDSACVVYQVSTGSYPVSFEEVWGTGVGAINWPGDVEAVCATEDTTVTLSDEDRVRSNQAYDQIALSIAAYEASPEVNAFTSEYDLSKGGNAKLSKQEQKGFALFQGKAGCKACHPSTGKEALFTDFTFDNLGVPRNPDNPFYSADAVWNPDGFDWVDFGLGGFLGSRSDYAGYADANAGKHKVPTLRNVAKGSCEAEPDNPDCIVKAYGHNGYFKSLEGIVHFYNTRDVKPTCADLFTSEADALTQSCWPAPEVAENVNTDELGDLGLTSDEEAAIVAFLKTLSDGYLP